MNTDHEKNVNSKIKINNSISNRGTAFSFL